MRIVVVDKSMQVPFGRKRRRFSPFRGRILYFLVVSWLAVVASPKAYSYMTMSKTGNITLRQTSLYKVQDMMITNSVRCQSTRLGQVVEAQGVGLHLGGSYMSANATELNFVRSSGPRLVRENTLVLPLQHFHLSII